jgi:hypothetical protein
MAEDAEFTLMEELQIGIWRFGIGEHVAIPLGRPATVEDLHLTKLKAEIVDGELIVIGPTVFGSAEAAWRIRESLYRYEKAGGKGCACSSRIAFVVDLPHRLSFCPDVSWYTGDTEAPGFPRGAPVFAAEIRDPAEYGHEAERRMAAKRADYFAAGTHVVWTWTCCTNMPSTCTARTIRGRPRYTGAAKRRTPSLLH